MIEPSKPTMNTQPSVARPTSPVLTTAWLIAVLGAGLVARFWFGARGHNYDLESWRIAADLVAEGKSVYANTDRYNYAPGWFIILHALDSLAGRNLFVFHQLLIAFLSAADIGIFYVLWRKFGRLPATVFFLNPVSIMITGYHNQFDNVAVLLGLWAVLCYGDDFEKPLNRRKYSALLLLGLSLIVKHLLFVFPFWLAVKQRGLLQKFLIMAVPTAMFFGSFLPFWSAGHDGIIAYVFKYQSSSALHSYFYNLLVPEFFRYMAGSKVYWLLCLAGFAFLCRSRPGLPSLLVYTGVLVAASPAISNQYLAIPAALASVELGPFFIAYFVLATAHLAVDVNGPHLFKNTTGAFDDLATVCLSFALIWMMWRPAIIRGVQNCRREINHQLGGGG
jgi:hypothetical protein